MLIDGGNAADSRLIYTYLKNYGVSHLDYIVCTHAHEDHVGGLAGALNYATVKTAYCPVREYNSKAFSNFLKYLDTQNVPITVPSPGDTFTLGSAEVQIVGPISPSENANNTSIVLRIVYGDTSFLFTGDAEREEELEIIEAGYDLQSTVLKVGHHGSDTSTSYPFLYMVEPDYAVISVGEGNPYGHPTEATLSKLHDADVTVYRTDEQGDIICRSDGKTVTFSTQKKSTADAYSGASNSEADATAENQLPVETTYVLNTRSKKFHIPECSGAAQMSEKNKQLFTGMREEVLAQGYAPCGICLP